MFKKALHALRHGLALQSLRSRILLVSLLSSLLISAFTAYMVGSITLRHHNAHLLEDTEHTLRNLVDLKRVVVESRLSDMEKGLLVFAANPDLAASAQALREALDASQHRVPGTADSGPLGTQTSTQISTQLTDYYQRQAEIQGIPLNDIMALRQSLDATAMRLQYQGMLDTATRKDWPAYWSAHDRIDPFLRTFRVAFPWYDLILLDPSDGRVLYTGIKEVDFGARVTQGPLAKTALARIFEQVRQQSGAAVTVMHDYAAYSPSGSSETLFIGVPVRKGKTLAGILVAQVDGEDFHQRLTNHNDWEGMGLGERGDLFLTGRTAELIISGGVNIYPVEIDEMLIRHPLIADAAVVGVPNEDWGEEIKAVVEVKAGVERSDETRQSIFEFAKERLPGFQRPRTIDFVDTLPRNAAGKVLRAQVRAPYWAGRSKSI